MKYIVFGAGNEVRLKYSNDFLEKIDWFVDNNQQIQGKYFCGKQVKSPESITEQESFVIVSVLYEYHNIRKQLEAMGLQENKDFVWGPNWYGNEDIPSSYGYKRWKDYDNIIDFSVGRWDYRVEKVAQCIDETAESVMDLGAGAMSLKKFIGDHVTYYPVDYCKREEHTIVCDFENHEFPEQKVDCVVASGILEYITDLEWFVERMCACTQSVVISYIPIEVLRDFSVRQHEGWRNNCTIVQLINLFYKHNFIPVCESMCAGCDVIIKFEQRK